MKKQKKQGLGVAAYTLLAVLLSSSAAWAFEVFKLEHSAFLDANGNVSITAELKPVEEASELSLIKFYVLRADMSGGKLTHRLVPKTVRLSLNSKAARIICQNGPEACLKDSGNRTLRRAVRALW